MAPWTFVAYVILAGLLAGAIVVVSYLLGERHRERETGEPYESGIPATASARARVPSHFYLVAMMFVVFDVEAVFIFAWAVSALKVGWLGFGEMLVFIGVLLAGLIYLWRSDVFGWGAAAQAARRARALASTGGRRPR